MEESRSALSFVFDVVRFLSAASLGLFAGAMLTEGGVLVPYWRSLEATEFFAWYGRNGHRLHGFFSPLTIVSALLAIAAASVSFWEGYSGRWLALLAAVISLSVVSMFFLYFQGANASFTAASLDTNKVPAELARWSMWNWWRTGLSFVAFAVAMLSLCRFKP
jgi:hypothetical protein